MLYNPTWLHYAVKDDWAPGTFSSAEIIDRYQRIQPTSVVLKTICPIQQDLVIPWVEEDQGLQEKRVEKGKRDPAESCQGLFYGG